MCGPSPSHTFLSLSCLYVYIYVCMYVCMYAFFINKSSLVVPYVPGMALVVRTGRALFACAGSAATLWPTEYFIYYP